VTLPREERLKALGLWPVWRQKGKAGRDAGATVAPASLPAIDDASPATNRLIQGAHSRGYLPHLKGDGVTYFVTFRLADSLAQETLRQWQEIPDAERGERIEAWLDAGHGECLLAQEEAAGLVEQALRHYATERYELHDYVIMPNHVHLLLTPRLGHALSDILHSLKSWTAQQINRRLDRIGTTLWQHESYDHVVRDDEDMQRIGHYIRENPVRARLVGDAIEYRWGSAYRAGKDAGATVAPASLPAIQAMDWDTLRQAVLDCTRCELHRSRTQGVFGVGDPRAEWLIVGEAPGAEEDRLGEPFVGPAGKLLDAMLAAIGLKRGENVYIANVLKSRPPKNRDPKPEEVAACLTYLERQIDLIQPKLILALGRFAAQSLLATDTAIGRLRGGLHRYRGLPLVVTYHPAYLLRNPADKAKVWEDLVLARETMQGIVRGPGVG